jgi:hypothetical protein
MDAIKEKFNISAESESNFIYLGLNVCQAAGKITIDQMLTNENLGYC